jgi:hypothetical protein
LIPFLQQQREQTTTDEQPDPLRLSRASVQMQQQQLQLNNSSKPQQPGGQQSSTGKYQQNFKATDHPQDPPSQQQIQHFSNSNQKGSRGHRNHNK